MSLMTGERRGRTLWNPRFAVVKKEEESRQIKGVEHRMANAPKQAGSFSSRMATDWRPISQAPKWGTLVLMWNSPVGQRKG
jgi:hypothetical protein